MYGNGYCEPPGACSGEGWLSMSICFTGLEKLLATKSPLTLERWVGDGEER